MNSLAKSPLKDSLTTLSNNFRKMEFNPLYWLTLPGFVLFSGGLYIGLYLSRTFHLGRNLPFEPTVLMVMMILLGTFMTFTGILLHSLSGLFRYLQG
jgi:hypothetical protein